jgi:hypothetical protein
VGGFIAGLLLVRLFVRRHQYREFRADEYWPGSARQGSAEASMSQRSVYHLLVLQPAADHSAEDAAPLPPDAVGAEARQPRHRADPPPKRSLPFPVLRYLDIET